MQLKVTRVDIEKSRKHWPREYPFAPAHIERREDTHNWHVLSAPLEPGNAPVWQRNGADEFIRIPLFPYMLNAEADLAFAFLLQLGLSCAGKLPGRVTAFHVATGVPVELAYDENNAQVKHLDYWVGFAVVVDEGA